VEIIAGDKYQVVAMNHEEPEWKNLIKPTMVNGTLSQRNKHHLQQASYKEEIGTKPPFTPLWRNSGFNDVSAKAIRGEAVEAFSTSPDMAEWFKDFQQSEEERE
jgi:hypothetical protein